MNSTHPEALAKPTICPQIRAVSQLTKIPNKFHETRLASVRWSGLEQCQAYSAARYGLVGAFEMGTQETATMVKDGAEKCTDDHLYTLKHGM